LQTKLGIGLDQLRPTLLLSRTALHSPTIHKCPLPSAEFHF
jgi:hypothetical protein